MPYRWPGYTVARARGEGSEGERVAQRGKTKGSGSDVNDDTLIGRLYRETSKLNWRNFLFSRWGGKYFRCRSVFMSGDIYIYIYIYIYRVCRASLIAFV